MSFCCTSDKVTISGIFQGCVRITLQQWMQQPCCRAVCRLVSVWRRQLYVRDMFPFPLPLSFEHTSVQLSGLYNCSWINDAAIVHLLVPCFFCWRFMTTCILKHHGGCKQSIFHAAHLWPEMSCVQNTVWNMCSSARDWSQDSDFLWIFMNRPSLNFNKNLVICKAHSHSVTKTISRKLKHVWSTWPLLISI